MPGTHWFYRFNRELELLNFLFKNFVFDCETLLQVLKDIQLKQKSNLNYFALLKIVNDFEILISVLEESNSNKNGLRKSMLKNLKKLERKMDDLAFDKKSKEKQKKLIDFLTEPQKLHQQINHRDKIWMNGEKIVPKIEKYANFLYVQSKEWFQSVFATVFHSDIFM